ncbi:hypothetical protein [Streptomyces sp. P17]|uniref:hypothetical protein n=1 Tax=Streptomyces sp. P17 TaxID=3074716 RepID=UPI0028F428BF|nr:hypothetical protein [Streptomyces sp. P17]MDT9701508.1 hypothetical protein [Streptomyces sp. P17]
MRLRTPCPATPRAWTVELRSHSGELVLVCRQCPHGPRRVTAAAARSAVLAHLAQHARADLRPPHLRICQCHERSCCWHPRHRGCAGPIRLLLARERGGRVWRLADACTACAAATAQAAVVPDTALAALPRLASSAARRRRRQPRGSGARTRVREMLGYLGVALPAGTSACARLLALQCALRMNAQAQVRLPAGLLRSLRLADSPASWRELERARWLCTTSSAANAVVIELLDATLLSQAPARPDRMQAADWALRAGRPAQVGTAGSLPQLASAYLAAHSVPETGYGLCEFDRMRHDCGILPTELHGLLDQLVGADLLTSWHVCPDSGDLHWTTGPQGAW